ncbi:MAG: S8 family serine peptidase [Rhodospirillaceae bacterium]|nr:S8 family serine peptidase [Rhodospirillaceae bacterium]
MAQDRLIHVLVEFESSSYVRNAVEAAAHSFGHFQIPPEALPLGLKIEDIDAGFEPLKRSKAASGFQRLLMGAPTETESIIVRATIPCARLQDLIAANGDSCRIYEDPVIAPFPMSPLHLTDRPLGTAEQVTRQLGLPALTAAELTGEGVAIAIIDTGIDVARLQARGVTARVFPRPESSHTPRANVRRFSPEHGTMCAFAAHLMAPHAALIDVPVLVPHGHGQSQIQALLSEALLAYNDLSVMLEERREAANFTSLVVSNSWGLHRPDDGPNNGQPQYHNNPNHPVRDAIDRLIRNGADVLFAAGNCGSAAPGPQCDRDPDKQDKIFGANGYQDVLCVGGVDVENRLVPYSCSGPGMWSHDKPDLAAPTHFLGSEARGTGTADVGTSTSCPVAAGCVAALRTKLPAQRMSPTDLADVLRQTASFGRDNVWNEGLGFGVIAPVRAAEKLGLL